MQQLSSMTLMLYLLTYTSHMKNANKSFILFILLITFTNINSTDGFSSVQSHRLFNINTCVEELKIPTLDTIQQINIHKVVVTSTIYHPTEAQTNSEPAITASGKKIDTSNAYKHRYIAVSRDLLSQGFKFGTKVKIEGSKHYDGIWIVHDLMSKRFSNKIDFLVNQGMPFTNTLRKINMYILHNNEDE